MAPLKNKKKSSVASISTPKDVVSGKKSFKRGKRTGVASKSSSEEVTSGKKVVEEKKDDDEKESVPTKVKKPCTWLKLDRLDPPLGSKSSLESCKQGKEAKVSTQAQASKDTKRKRDEEGEGKGHKDPTHEKRTDSNPERKEKETVEYRCEDTKLDDESEKALGGLIFMCNAKTKPDCFKYQLMGVPASKKEVVMKITPGLIIFLYDYDLKLMYGVFEASSAGGMKLEPTAFGGAFPAQVRFNVHKDCLPLPESVFKKAIKDGYDERTHKFKTELTVKQVKNLINVFRPAPLLHPNGKSMVQEPTICSFPPASLLSEESLMRQRYLNNYGNSDTQGKSIPLNHENQFSDFRKTVPPQDPPFLTEQQYRINGLHQVRHLMPATAGDNVGHTWDPNKLDVELKQLLRNPASTSIVPALQSKQVDPLFLGEMDYRIYGLRGPQQVLNTAPPMTSNKDICDPYDESTTLLVNRYLAMPMSTGVPAKSYPLAGREPYIDDLNHTSGIRSHPHEQSVFNQRSYSLNDTHEPSKLNRGIDFKSAPVSNRYSFAGPSQSHHR